MLIRCRQLSFGSKSQIRCRTRHSTANANSLRRHSFGSESQFRCRTHDSAANHKFAAGNSVLTVNANSLQTIQFRQQITNSLQNTPFDSECQFAVDDTVSISLQNTRFDSECYFAATNSVLAADVNPLQPTQFRQRITISL
jgi:hypothetical protein